MFEISKEHIPDEAVHLGTDWQNNHEFPTPLKHLLNKANVNGDIVLVVTTRHFDSNNRYEQWSKDYYSVSQEYVTMHT